MGMGYKRSPSTIETLFGSTNGTGLTGNVPLQSYLTETTLGGTTPETVNLITIPKGIRAKIWIELMSGAICTLNLVYNANTGAASSTSYTMPTNAGVQISSLFLASSGVIEADERRPVVVDGFNVGSAVAQIQFQWSQSVAAVTNFRIKIEWTLVDDN